MYALELDGHVVLLLRACLDVRLVPPEIQKLFRIFVVKRLGSRHLSNRHQRRLAT